MEATAVIWASLILVLAVLAYTYVGYPLLATVLGRLLTRPVRRKPIEPRVSFIIAAMNEERDIARKLENTLALDYPRSKLEIVVASDGSTDRTDEIVTSFADERVRLFRAGSHLGKTETANRVVPTTCGEILVFADATGRFEPEALKKLLQSFADPQVGAVTGRVIYRYGRSASAEGFRFYQRFVVANRRAESAFGTETSISGSIHALRRELFRPAPSALDYDMVHPLHVAMEGCRTVYETDAVSEEEARESAPAEFRARMRMATQAYTFLPYLLRRLPVCRNRLYVFQVLSHKVLRWLSPHFLVLFLIFSGILSRSSPWAMALLLLQLAFYATALAGYLGQRAGKLLPCTSIPLFFVTMNLAYLVGFWKWLSGERRGAWKPAR